MKRNLHSSTICLVLGLLAAAAPVARSQEKATVAAGGEVKVTVVTGSAAAPQVSITLYGRHGHVTPCKGKCTHTGGGLIDVSSPTPDVVILTMSGAVVANSEMKFDLEQCFEIAFDDPKVKKAKLTIEGRVIGVLRGHKKGGAEYADACAHVNCGPQHILSVCVPPHSVAGCENLAVNDHDGPCSVPVMPGKFTLQQTFRIAAHSDCCLFKRPSAEFAPDPALDPLWITYYDPFHGVKKDTFGFQITLKVAPEEDKKDDKPTNGKEGAEKLPAPKP